MRHRRGIRPTDCVDVNITLDKVNGVEKSPGDVYDIYIGDELTDVQVVCDLETAGGGWTVCTDLRHICSVLS